MRARPGPFGVATAVLFGALIMPNLDLFDGLAAAESEKTRQAECLTSDDLDESQLANAEAIIATGNQLGVPERGHVVALATAMQESSLRADLDESESDRDSAGLFQQRAAWGALADRMDPAASTRMFYHGGAQGQPGLLDIDGWEDLPITVAAQKVQRSAYPDAYADDESLARDLVGQTGGCDT